MNKIVYVNGYSDPDNPDPLRLALDVTDTGNILATVFNDRGTVALIAAHALPGGGAICTAWEGSDWQLAYAGFDNIISED